MQIVLMGTDQPSAVYTMVKSGAIMQYAYVEKIELYNLHSLPTTNYTLAVALSWGEKRHHKEGTTKLPFGNSR